MANKTTNGIRGLLPIFGRPRPAERQEPAVESLLMVTIRNGTVQTAALDGVPLNVAVRDYDAATRRRKAFEDLPIDDDGHRYVESLVAAD